MGRCRFFTNLAVYDLRMPPAHAIHFLKPSAALLPFVRFYCQREVRLQSGAAIVHPVLARAAPMIEFLYGDRFRVQACANGSGAPAFGGVVVGLQTHRRVELVMRGALEAFAIFFQPSGLNRLLGVSMEDLTDHHYEARSVFGLPMLELEQRLGACPTFEYRARLADGWLLNRARHLSTDAVSAAASEILRRGGRMSTLESARLAGLGIRQFERRFAQQVGMSPKLYARIARFEAALDAKAHSPTGTWSALAHDFGYHDHMHLVHDFREFSGETPTAALTQVESSYRVQIEAMRLGRTPARQMGEPPLIM
jgi:AraC-like DNA-binding protein